MSGDYKSVPCDAGYLDSGPTTVGHEKFSGWCGRLECELEVLTLLCINTWDKNKPPARIQGSTIKGMVRSVAEIVSQSRFRIGSSPPTGFEACTSEEEACTCCRLFGGNFTEHGESSKESSAFQSKVFFEETFVPATQLNDDKTTVHVSHQTGNCDPDERRVFPHFQPRSSGETSFRVWTVPPGTIFEFGVEFECLDDDELGLLLYSLVLESDMAHKMGFMKSRGLGSVKIKITKLELTDNYSDVFSEYDSSVPVIEDYDEIECFVRRYKNQYIERNNLDESNHLQVFRNLMKCDFIENEEE